MRKFTYTLRQKSNDLGKGIMPATKKHTEDNSYGKKKVKEKQYQSCNIAGIRAAVRFGNMHVVYAHAQNRIHYFWRSIAHGRGNN